MTIDEGDETGRPRAGERGRSATQITPGSTVGDLGEFGLIAAVTARLPQGAAVLVGPGDDAAVLATPNGRVVATTDLLVEGRHFRRDWSSGYDAGRKAAAQNLADVMAMGARPTALLVGLGAPAELEASWALDLADGLRDEGALAGASVVGGDVVRADAVILGVTALGDLAGLAPVRRSGARPGDVVVVAGRLGWAAAGLAVLAGGFLAGGLRALGDVVEAHRQPRPPYDLGPELAAAGATAMCDVSDGLLQDLGHLATASGVRIELERSALPVDQPLRDVATTLAADPYGWVLTGGDDHALVATLPPDVVIPGGCGAVGRVVAGEGVAVDGRSHSGSAGHDHFR